MKRFLTSLFATLPLMHPSARAETAPAADAANQFAFDCLEHLRTEKGNLAFSPFSAWSALTMTSGGATGKTLDEMSQVLHHPKKDDSIHTDAGAWLDQLHTARDIELRVANRLWPATGFKIGPSFLELTDKRYHAPVEPLDFAKDREAARGRINRYVEEQTNDRIRNLLQPSDVSDDTLLVLTNAIYFKAGWLKEFDPENTRPFPFTATDGTVIPTPGMFRKEDLPWHENDSFVATRLPYKGGQTSMILVLPQKGRRVDEKGLLNKPAFDKMLSSFSTEKVIMRLPRFTASQRVSMRSLLESLGMKTAFLDAATFDRISANPPLKIGAVIHQAFVMVGEKGTEAAAATAVSMRAGSAAPRDEPKVFIADRPFLFFIMDDRTGGILFTGRVEAPEEAR